MSKIICGSALDVLMGLPSESVDQIVTSPAYWNLRDYGIAGQLGAEESPEEYIQNLAAIFKQAKRVLKKQGTFFLNLGDSYWGSGRGFGADYENSDWKQASNRGSATHNKIPSKTTKKHPVFKQKDLMLLPSRVAIALQEDGWILRNKIIWHKPNAMPASVKDRFTNDYEEVFFFVKSKHYFYDYEAMKEPQKDVSKERAKRGRSDTHKYSEAEGAGKQGINAPRQAGEDNETPENRNKRTVWTIPTTSYKGAHFATMPIALAETCIKAGCPEGGIVCDPFGGAGTTAVAAMKNRRDYLLIELNEDYIPLIERRVQNVQRPLFLGADL